MSPPFTAPPPFQDDDLSQHLFNVRYFDTPEPYEVDDATTPGTIYMRYTNHDPCKIKRITETTFGLRIEKAIGSWDDRVTLEYIPINSPFSNEPTWY